MKILKIILFVLLLTSCSNDRNEIDRNSQYNDLKVTLSTETAATLGISITNATLNIVGKNTNTTHSININSNIESIQLNNIHIGDYNLYINFYDNDNLVSNGTYQFHIPQSVEPIALTAYIQIYNAQPIIMFSENNELLLNGTEPVDHSFTGSSRATAYSSSYKFANIGNNIFSTYLAYENNEYNIKLAINDISDMINKSSITIGKSRDNHGGASLLVDDTQNMHMFYGGHGDFLKYRHASNPEVLSSWSTEKSIAFGLTYPSAVTLDNTILLAARYGTNVRSTDPWTLNLYKIESNSVTNEQVVFVSNQQADELVHRYVNFQHKLHISKNGRVHLTFLIHERPVEDINAIGLGYGIAHIYSDDKGQTWKSDNNEVLELPININTINLVAGVKKAVDAEYTYLSFDTALHPITEDVYIISNTYDIKNYIYELWLHKKESNAVNWNMRTKIFEGLYGSRFSILEDGTFFILTENNLTNQLPIDAWKEPYKNIILLKSHDNGESYTSHEISEANSSLINWLPTMQTSATTKTHGYPFFYMYTSGSNELSTVKIGKIID